MTLFQSSRAFHTLQAEHFKLGEICPEIEIADDLAPMTFEQMAGAPPG